jgi:hypothetical protein
MRFPGAVLVVLATLAAGVASADAATYRVTFSGTQELTWKVDGTTSACESRRGAGQGTVKLSIKGDKPATMFSSGSKRISLLGSIPSTVKGSITGQFTDTLVTRCQDFEPGPAVTAPTTGCGATAFDLRVDFKPVGAFTYLVGPSMPGGKTGEGCPDFQELASSNERTACGDDDALHRRSWGVASSHGAGMFATRLSAAQTKAVKRGGKKTLTGRTPVECTLDSQYSGGVKLVGVLKYSVSVKRTG